MEKLAILAGGGILPAHVAKAAVADGKEVIVIQFTGQPQPENIPEGIIVHQQPLGAVGSTLKLLKKEGVTAVMLAGFLHKPSLFDLKPDVTGMLLLGKLAVRHDDALLTGVCDVLHEHGFTLVSVQDMCPDLLANADALGAVKPTSTQLKDIELGQSTLQHMAPLDIGQAVVVKDKTVLGVEAVEGTEALLARCADLRGKENAGGVLVKLPKQQQSRLADLPTIGVDTIEQLATAGYAGVAVGAGQTLILEKEKVQALADKYGLFVWGLPI